MSRIGNATENHVRVWVDGHKYGDAVLAPHDYTDVDALEGSSVELRAVLNDLAVAATKLKADAKGVVWLQATPSTSQPGSDLPLPLPGVIEPPAVLNARGQMPVWQDYVTVVEQKVSGADDLFFNARECPVRRSVVISAAYMEWTPTTDPVLRAYEGVQVLDLAELELVADHIVISTALRFPGTDVTIRCRVLEFRDDQGRHPSIDTSAIDFPVGVPAFSTTRWSNPDDKDDHTSYPGVTDSVGGVSRATSGQAGAPGHDAGSITLQVKELQVPLNAGKLFVGRGGRGQEGEPGGLNPRAKGDTTPTTVTRKDVSAVIKTFAKANSIDSWSWPREMFGLLDPNREMTNAVYARLLCVDNVAFEDDSNEFVLQTSWYKYTALGNSRSNVADFWARKGNSASAPPEPAFPQGPSAYPGGPPGASGKGASVTTNFDGSAGILGYVDHPGGLPAAATASASGAMGRAGTDLIAVEILATKKDGWKENNDFTPESRSHRIASSKGLDAPGVAAPPPGAAGGLHVGTDVPQVIQVRFVRIAAAVGTTSVWLQAGALDAVLARARDTFRAGFRDEAWSLLEPYHAERLVGHSVPEPQGIVIEALRHRLNANLDYRGRPVGYVPRLDAMSSFTNHQTIRRISQLLISYADDGIAAFDQLESKLDTVEQTRQALAVKIEQAEARVRSGMQALGKAMADLEAVTEQVQAKKARIAAVTAEATLAAKGQVTAQEVFSGCCHLVGGVLQAIPVGQPYVGLAGSMVGSVGDFTIQPPPGQSQADFFAAQTTVLASNLGGDVKTFLSKSQDQMVLSSTADPSIYNQQSESQKLSALIAKAKAGLTSDEQATASANGEQIKALEEFADAGGAAIAAKATDKAKLDELIKGQADLRAKADAAFDADFRARRGIGGVPADTKAAYQEAITQMKAHADSIADAKTKVATHDKAFADAKTALGAAAVRRDDLDAKVKQAKLDQDNRRQQVTDACGRLRNAGEGLTAIGAGIGELVRSANVTDDDPKVKEIVKAALESSADFAALQQEFADLAKTQAAAVATLQGAQSTIAGGHSDIAGGLDQIAALTLKVTDMSGLADARTRQHLSELKERGREFARESIDTVVAALRYEFLLDIRPDALDDQLGVKIGAVNASNADSTPSNKDTLTALDKEYWAALCSLALEATNVSAQRASAKKQPTAKPLLGGDFLGQLSASGRITVHGVFDLRIVPSFTWHAARVTDIRVTALDTEPRLAPGDYLDVLIEHSGRQLILEQEEIPAGGGSDEKPASHYYFFQSGTDVARQWSARAQFKDGLTANDVTRPVTDVDPNAKNLIQLMLASNAAPAANVMFTPYNPGIYSLFTIGVSRPPAADGSPVPLPKITKLALEIDYTASFDDSISRNREVTR